MRSKPYPKGKEGTPGPGNDNLRNPKQLDVPSYKFGNEKKGDMALPHSKFVPGPGNYDFNADALHENHPKFTFGKEARGNEQAPKTPGPGQYDYKHFIGKEAPRITMSAKYRTGLDNGDTSYVPGQYGPDHCTNLVRPKTPSWKIGTAKRQDLNGRDRFVPGVGNYNVTKGIGNGPKYTMVGKGNTGNFKNGVPGPGQYTGTNAIYVKNPAWKIGTGTRGDELRRIKKENPGPGQYHIPCAIVDVNNYTREQGQFNPNYKFI